MDYKNILKQFIPEPVIISTRPLRLYFEPQRKFDRKFGVETSGLVEPDELGVEYDDDDEPGGYEPTPRAAFVRILKSLALDYERFTFVDLGSGKGAVLLYACEFPFKKIVGVEFSPKLYSLGDRNIAAYRAKAKARANIETVCINAAAYPIPPEPAVFFLFNPFKGRTFEIVVDNIERSLLASPRELFVIYYYTFVRHDALDRAGRLEVHRRGEDHTIYRARKIT